MKNKLTAIFFIVALFACSMDLMAQSPTICNTTTRNICPTAAFTLTRTGGGTGLTPNLAVSNPIPNPFSGNNGCMYADAVNPEWLIINISSSGNLGFILGAPAPNPNPQSTFLHWILWKYTPTTCTNIFNNTLAPLSCNSNGFQTGGTGMGPVPVSGFAANYQASIPVLAGEQYLLLVSNVANANTTINFVNNGTAGITCYPLTIPNFTSCPGQCVVNSASWPGVTNTQYTVFSPSGAQPTIMQSSPNFTLCSPATGVYTLNATGIGGGQPVSTTRLFTVTVVPTQPLLVTYDTNYCFNSCANFTLAPVQGTFSISGPGIAPTTPTTNNILTICNLQSPNNNGTYTVISTFATGCTGLKTIQVNIAPDNFITLTPNNALDVCLGSTGVIGASMPTATAFTIYSPCSPTPTTVPVPVLGGNNVTFNLPNMQPSCAGIYTVTGNINYNGITCIRQATVLVRVVQTYPVIANSSYTFCEGTPACLTVSAQGTTPNSFTWSGPLAFSSNLQNPCITQSITTAPNPNMAGGYFVQAEFNNGFFSCYTSTVINVQVVSVPQIFMAMQSTICQYDFFSACITPNATSYQWIGPAGLTSTNQCIGIPNIQLLQAGTYTTMSVYSIGTRTCSTKATKNLAVQPVADVSVTPNQTICQPYDNINLAADALGALTYSWAGPNSFTSNIRTPIIYYPPLNASGVYTVYVSFNNGYPCFNTNTIAVSVNPVLSFTLPPFLRTCYDQSVTVTGPAGATSYTWSGSSGFNSNTKDLVLSPISPSNSGIYNLNVNLGPCVSSRQTEIEVLTPITLSLSPLSREICKNDTSLFQVGAVGGSEVYAYNWFPSNYLTSPTGSAVIGQVLGTTVFLVNYYDVACPAKVFPYNFTVTVDRPPVPDLQLAVTEGCDPLNITFNTRTNNMLNGGITTFYFDDVIKKQGDIISQSFGPGSHSVKIETVAKFADRSCTETYEHPDLIVVHPKAAPAITWSPDVPNTTDNIATFNATSRYSVINYFNWMFSGTNSRQVPDTSDLANPVRTYEETGKYPIMLIATTDFGCIDTTITFIEIKDDMNVFIPNSFTPNNDGINDVFQVKGIGFKAESFFIEVFDRWGHVVYTSKDVTKGWDGSIKGQTPSEGLYIYRVRIIGANGEGRKEYMGNVTLLR